MDSSYKGMKVLELDIETAPNLVYAWRLFKENITIDRVIESGYTLCFAAKWQHEDAVVFESLYESTMDEMLQVMWDLLDEADVVVHYNGKSFDMPTLNREFVKAGMVPPTNYKQIDLYRVVRSQFKFASNKMDFVCRELGLQTKTQHKGMQLWKDCMEGVETQWGGEVSDDVAESWATMEEYNVGDIEMLHQLYVVLLPWIKFHPNRSLYMDDNEDLSCPNCSSTNIVKKGIERPSTVNAYQRYKCKDCGTNSRGRLALKNRAKPALVGV